MKSLFKLLFFLSFALGLSAATTNKQVVLSGFRSTANSDGGGFTISNVVIAANSITVGGVPVLTGVTLTNAGGLSVNGYNLSLLTNYDANIATATNNVSAWANGRFLTSFTESDPIFSSWLGTNLYVKVEADPVFSAWLAGASLVNSFNTRTGAVTLLSADVTTALGYTPQTNGAYLVGVASGNAYITPTTNAGVVTVTFNVRDLLATNGNGSALTGLNFSQLGGTLAAGQLTFAVVTNALGPYVTALTSNNVTTALGQSPIYGEPHSVAFSNLWQGTLGRSITNAVSANTNIVVSVTNGVAYVSQNNTIKDVTATAGTLTVDFGDLAYQRHGMTGSVAVTTTNWLSGIGVVMMFTNGSGSPQTISFSTNWTWLGGALASTNLPSGKTSILSLTRNGTNDAGIISAYATQQ